MSSHKADAVIMNESRDDDENVKYLMTLKPVYVRVRVVCAWLREREGGERERG